MSLHSSLVLPLLLSLALPTPAQSPASAAPQPSQPGVKRPDPGPDWPNLNRYRAENAQLGDPAPGVKRVVFLGDSITDGWGRGHGSFFPGKPYINRGISGQTTPQMLVRFQQDVVTLKPAAVVILAGTNDLAGNTGPEPMSAIEDNFRSMVAIAKAAHVRVILSSVLPADRFPWRPGLEPAAQIRELNHWIEGFAREQRLVYLNYYPALATPEGAMRPELATDKAVHPNDAGYALMQPLAEAAIARALASPAP